ncbi:MAG: BlaI/MecI/CopY family transcriptional regulator [Clostridia bacterium]|nr:BlaI/MecI/CopY family transcriptional regulator [Clostridia bacterium]
MAMPPLGDQELELLRFVTEHAPITVREAVERYGKDHCLARTTILTMMERLRAKGYLTRSEVGGVNEYSSCLSRSELMRGVVRGFVEKTLGGALSPFVAYLADNASVSPKELEDLKRLVEELESREGKK